TLTEFVPYYFKKERYQMPNETTRSSGILLGSVIGGAMGIITTLLLAPKSGAKLREELLNQFHSIRDRTKDVVATVGGTTKDVVESVKEEVASLAEHAKESNQNMKEAFTSKTDGIKDKLTAANK